MELKNKSLNNTPGKYYIIVLFLVSFSYLVSGLKAQDPNYQHFDIEDGLPSNTIYDINQDLNGYIWIGTDAGVSRFDGEKFENFTTADGLADNDILYIKNDKKGRVWFLSFNGKMSYFYKNIFYNSSNDLRIIDSLNNAPLFEFFEDESGTIWISADWNGIIKIDSTGIEYRTQESGFPKCQIRGLHQRGGITYHTVSKSACMITDMQQLSSGIRPDLNLSHARLICAPTGDYFVYAKEKVYKKESNEYKLIYHHSREVFANAFSFDRKGNLWISYPDNGIMKLSNNHIAKEGKIFLPGINVSNMFEDSEGDYWFCTLSEGFYFLRNNNLVSYSTREGLIDVNVTKLVNLDKESLLIGTISGLFKMSGSRIEKVLFKNEEIGEVKDFLRVSDELTYLLTRNEMYIFQNGKLQFEIKTAASKGIALDQNGDIWYADTRGIHCLNLATDVPGIFLKVTEGNRRCTSLFFDKRNNLWIGTTNGLFVFDGKELQYLGDLHEHLAATISEIIESPSGKICVGLQGFGFCMIDENNWQNVFLYEGLENGFVQDIYFESENHVWVATKYGLEQVIIANENKQNDFKSITYTNWDGLASNDVTSITKVGNKFYAGTAKGVSIFNEVNLQNFNFDTLKVNIQSFVNNDSSFSLKNLRPFHHSQNNIRIKYVGISFRNMNRIGYQYRFVNQDSSWTHTENSELEFASLQPGNYHFQVRARIDGVELYSEIQDIRFVIEKPVWARLWFISLIILLVIIILALVVARVIISQRRREALKRRGVESELKALRAQMNPHFIFNSLNSIILFIANNEKEKAFSYLSQFGKLIRQILDNSSKSWVKLSEEIQSLELYMQLESVRTDHKFKYEVKIADDINDDEQMIPPMLIQPFLENSIWHGIMPLDRESGNIYLKIELEGDILKCIVEDDGIGRERAAELKADIESLHKSKGVEITKERLVLVNEQSSDDIELYYEDLIVSGKPVGTRVTLTIPQNIYVLPTLSKAHNN